MTTRFGARDRSARADGSISRGRADVWQPIIDLHFADNSGIAQWWLPELVLLGNTDNGLRARGTVAWQQENQRFSYEHTNRSLGLDGYRRGNRERLACLADGKQSNGSSLDARRLPRVPVVTGKRCL